MQVAVKITALDQRVEGTLTGQVDLASDLPAPRAASKGTVKPSAPPRGASPGGGLELSSPLDVNSAGKRAVSKTGGAQVRPPSVLTELMR